MMNKKALLLNFAAMPLTVKRVSYQPAGCGN
jgi:hypothetical protein